MPIYLHKSSPSTHLHPGCTIPGHHHLPQAAPTTPRATPAPSPSPPTPSGRQTTTANTTRGARGTPSKEGQGLNMEWSSRIMHHKGRHSIGICFILIGETSPETSSMPNNVLLLPIASTPSGWTGPGRRRARGPGTGRRPLGRPWRGPPSGRGRRATRTSTRESSE